VRTIGVAGTSCLDRAPGTIAHIVRGEFVNAFVGTLAFDNGTGRRIPTGFLVHVDGWSVPVSALKHDKVVPRFLPRLPAVPPEIPRVNGHRPLPRVDGLDERSQFHGFRDLVVGSMLDIVLAAYQPRHTAGAVPGDHVAPQDFPFVEGQRSTDPAHAHHRDDACGIGDRKVSVHRAPEGNIDPACLCEVRICTFSFNPVQRGIKEDDLAAIIGDYDFGAAAPDPDGCDSEGIIMKSGLF